MRQSRPPQIAVVRLRKGEWVLPKGKLDDGETPRDAAEREVLEETGHDVSVHEFLGTLAYDAGGRSKIVHYWRMETQGRPTRELMRDVIAVDWLPLDAALERLSREHERAFLANVGPLALESAALARRSREISREARAPAPVKRRRPPISRPAPALAPPVAPSADDVGRATGPRAVEHAVVERDAVEHGVIGQSISRPDDAAIDAFASLLTREIVSSPRETGRSDVMSSGAELTAQDELAEAPQYSRVNVMQRVRSWLRRAG